VPLAVGPYEGRFFVHDAMDHGPSSTKRFSATKSVPRRKSKWPRSSGKTRLRKEFWCRLEFIGTIQFLGGLARPPGLEGAIHPGSLRPKARSSTAEDTSTAAGPLVTRTVLPRTFLPAIEPQPRKNMNGNCQRIEASPA